MLLCYLSVEIRTITSHDYILIASYKLSCMHIQPASSYSYILASINQQLQLFISLWDVMITFCIVTTVQVQGGPLVINSLSIAISWLMFQYKNSVYSQFNYITIAFPVTIRNKLKLSHKSRSVNTIASTACVYSYVAIYICNFWMHHPLCYILT